MWLLSALNKCSAQGKECYNCSGQNHCTALCRHQRSQWPSHDARSLSSQADCPEEIPGQGNMCHPDDRHRSSWFLSRCHCCPMSHSSSCSPSPYWSTKSPRCSTRCHTPFWYNQNSIKVIPVLPTDSTKTSTYPKEGSLLMEWASDGQVSFYTHLMVPTKNGTMSMMVKIDPGAQVNTIPLSRYWKLFP